MAKSAIMIFTNSRLAEVVDNTDAGVTDETRDFRLSPYTGWTRAHWEQRADRMLLAVRQYASPGNSLIELPGPASRSGQWSDGLEGFARTFLLAAFRLAGANGTDPLGIGGWYAAGLTAGTDPASRLRWPRPDEIGQAKVEAASIAIALHETRPWIWDRLDAGVQEQVLDWLGGMTRTPVPENNWVWFRAVVSAFLRNAGGPWDPADMSYAIERTEDWYAGDGWYSDGCPRPGDFRNFDHYSGWAMHLYPLWFCRIAGTSAEPGLAQRYRLRLRRYLADAEHLVGGDGSPLFQGRSLTYRFAALAPFWAGALFDATPLAPGLTRRIASGMLNHFLSAGCLRTDGTLSLGWHGEFLPIRQAYSGPGSPYWASKGFAGLLLPAGDPVWRSAEEPMAVERGDFGRVIAAPGWVVSGTTADGIVRVANHGTDHGSGDPGQADDPFYCRWSYATRTGPDLSGPADASSPASVTAPVDSQVSLIDAAGRPSHRRPLRRVLVSGPAGVSRHQAHWPATTDGESPAAGPWLTTASVLRGCWEIRAVRVDPDPAGSGAPAGFDAPAGTGAPAGSGADLPWFLRIGGWVVASGQQLVQDVSSSTAFVRGADGLVSVVSVLHGSMTPAVHRPSGPHAFGTHTAVPYLQSTDPAVPCAVYAAAVALTADPAGPGEPPSVETGPADDGAELRIRWADGDLDQLILQSRRQSDEP
jgi:hypothetical protein